MKSPITLDEILEKYRHIHLADESDGPEINKFLETVPMDTSSLILRYSRGDDFFAFFKIQAEKFFVFKFLNPDGSIGGMSVITLRRGYVDGEATVLGYLCDLRVSPTLNKRARVEWRKCYAEVLKEVHHIKDFDGCRYMYSAILGENENALSALTNNKSEIIYETIQSYRALNILGRIPFKRFKVDATYECRFAVNDDLALIKNYLMNQNKAKAFGDFFSEEGNDELARRLNSWENLKIEKFILCFNDGELVGVVCPWTTQKTRKLIIEDMSLPLQIMGKTIPLLSLRKPVSKGDELKILYLTHLELKTWQSDEEKEQCFGAMLNFIFKNKMQINFHLIQLLEFGEKEVFESVLKTFYLYQKVPAYLFQVMHRDHYEAGDFLVKNNQNITFELGVS